MKKAELIAAAATESGVSKKEAEKVIDAVFAEINKTLAGGDSMTIYGFGTFSVSERKERTGRNPRTGETTTIPAAKVVHFKPAKALKDSVNA